MQLSRCGRIVTVTLAVALVQWLLFELIRIPYRPPHDMLTFLGQEKYSVIGFMGVVTVGWVLYVLIDGLWPLPALHDVLKFGTLLSILVTITAAIVIYPPWPVTPLYLLFK
jgi:hypothetical protein